MTEWRVYGCGSASSNLSLQTSYEIVDGDSNLHIDFGNGAIYQRCRAVGDINQVLDDIQHIFITHCHPDHCIELTRHAVAWRYTPGYSPGKPVHLYGTETTLNAVRKMLGNGGLDHIFDEVYIPHEIKAGKSFLIEDLTITPFNVKHIPGSVGLRIETTSGQRIVFTGDTGPFDELSAQLENLDLLIAEASFAETQLFMHLRIEETAKLAGEVNPNTLLLVHFYPEIECKPVEELRQVVSKYYSGPLFPAQDGLALRWNDGKKEWIPSRMF